jgi:hypothetical protein
MKCKNGHSADRIGEDTHGRPYFWCAECGIEWQTDDPTDGEGDEDDDEGDSAT